MARIALTRTPTDIIDTVSELEAGTTYSIQAEPTLAALVHLDDSDSTPDVNEGRKLRPLETARAAAGDGGSLWAWAPDANDNNPVYINVYEEP